MFDNELAAMMALSEQDNNTEETNVEQNTEQTEQQNVTEPQITVSDVVENNVAETPAEDNSSINDTDKISVSELILQNADKYLKMTVVNSKITEVSADADVTNYIVYVNTEKKIPCIYDCERLYVPKASVKNADGTWNITSIEGRRSGFIVKCPGRDLVMSKNFIYDCTLDENNNITSVKQYNRKQTIETITKTLVTDYEAAALHVQKFLPKIVKCGKYTTMEALKQQVKSAYSTVNDINAMMNIIDLRLTIGC